MQTTIIVPCYNEEKRLPINAFLFFVEKNKNVQFLFVNDGSKDNTLKILTTLSSKNGRILILDLQNNRGKAEAVRQGMLHAVENLNSDYIGFWDADLAVPLSEIERFIDCFQKNDSQMVMGCRLMRLGANVKRKKSRHYLGRSFATAASMLLNLQVYDTQCGAKLFKANIVSSLFEKPFISKWIFDVELLARYITIFGLEDAAKKIFEYPLSSWEDIAGSSIKIKDFLRAPVELWKIKRKYLK
jgi:glycosyltransferase involved in cell wall biosynthesis